MIKSVSLNLSIPLWIRYAKSVTRNMTMIYILIKDAKESNEAHRQKKTDMRYIDVSSSISLRSSFLNTKRVSIRKTRLRAAPYRIDIEFEKIVEITWKIR